MRSILFLLSVFCFSLNLSGQNTTVNCSVIDFFVPPLSKFQEKDKAENKKLISVAIDQTEVYPKVMKIQSYVLEKMVKDKRFNLVERSKLNLIKSERELQKSEDFIDGYITGQSQSIGADYLIMGDYEMNEMTMTISAYSVKDQKLLASEVVKLKSRLSTNFRSIKDPIDDATERLMENIAPSYISIIEVTKEKKGSAKEILMAAGSGRNLKEGDDIEFKILEMREIEGEEMQYYKTIATGEVDKIEDANFSLVEVKKGGSELLSYQKKGIKVFCKKVLD